MNRNVTYITSTRACFGSCASRRSRPRQSSLARRARSRSRRVVRSHLFKIRLRRRARALHHPAEIHRRRRRRRRRASSSRVFAGDLVLRAGVAARSSSVCSVSLILFAAPAMRVSISYCARGRSNRRRARCVWSVCTPRVHETTPPPPPIVAHARARCCCCSRPRRGTRCSRSRARRSSRTRRCERRAVTTPRRDATRRDASACEKARAIDAAAVGRATRARAAVEDARGARGVTVVDAGRREGGRAGGRARTEDGSRFARELANWGLAGEEDATRGRGTDDARARERERRSCKMLSARWRGRRRWCR